MLLRYPAQFCEFRFFEPHITRAKGLSVGPIVDVTSFSRYCKYIYIYIYRVVGSVIMVYHWGLGRPRLRVLEPWPVGWGGELWGTGIMVGNDMQRLVPRF